MLVKPALLHFKFDGFADLPSEVAVDYVVPSDVQTDCNGNEWILVLYGKPSNEVDDPGWFAPCLENSNKEVLDISYELAIKDANGILHFNKEESYQFGPYETRENDQFMEVAKILDPDKNILKDGALCIDVTIQVKPSLDDLHEYMPSLPDKMKRLLESEENSDATFNVGGEMFKVHSLIIDTNAPPILANALNRNDSDTAFVLGVTPEIFRLILQFIYTGLPPYSTDVTNFGKELIDAADKYDLPELKFGVENMLVCERIMNRENVSDWILFADAKSCPLLKEYAISYFLMDSRGILKSEHSQCLRESSELLCEIMMLMGDGDGGMTVTELREELSKRELDVDGSKETLVARLESAMN